MSINGNTVTLKFKEDIWFTLGSSVNLYFQLPYETDDKNITITNLALNNKYATLISKDSENNTIDNTVTENNTITNTENNTVTNTENNITNTIPEIDENSCGTYALNVNGFWQNDGYYIYNAIVQINYTGETTDSWEISFDVPDGLNVQSSTIWAASNISISGNTVTITPHSWNGTINKDSTFNLEMQLAFDSNVDLKINNLKINGKSVQYSS